MRAEQAVLECIASNYKVTVEAIAEQTGLSERQVERTIRRLRETGRLERVGGARGHWVINE